GQEAQTARRTDRHLLGRHQDGHRLDAPGRGLRQVAAPGLRHLPGLAGGEFPPQPVVPLPPARHRRGPAEPCPHRPLRQPPQPPQAGLRRAHILHPAPRALVAVMLGDAAKIHEEDAAYLNRKRAKGEPKVEPLYEGPHVYRTLLRLKAVPYDVPVTIAPGIEATFVDAGHLLGSAMIGLRLDGPAGQRPLTFT